MSSIFTKIINGELPAYKVAENEKFLAFLDISPIAKGHTLVIPKTEVDYMFNIEDELLAEMWLFAKKVALKIENAIPCQRVGVAVIGLEVPLAHILLVPINHVGDINFSQPKLSFTQEEMKDICDTISNA